MTYIVVVSTLTVGMFTIAALWAWIDARRASRVRQLMLAEGRNGALLAAVNRDLWIARIFLFPFLGMSFGGALSLIGNYYHLEVGRFIIRVVLLMYLFVGAAQYTIIKWYLTRRIDVAIAQSEEEFHEVADVSDEAAR